MEDGSFVKDFGPNNSSCGYCGKANGFFTHGMLASKLATQTYQDLLDIGWRRSGNYVYKPDLSRMCCPTYTIRLKADDFVPDATHKKALRKLQRYLDGGPLTPASTAASSKNDRKAERNATALQRVCSVVLQQAMDAFMKQEDIQRVQVDVAVQQLNQKQRNKLPSTVFLSSPVCLTLFHKLRRSTGSHLKWESPQEICKSFCQFLNQTNESPEGNDIVSVSRNDFFSANITVLHTDAYINFQSPIDEIALEKAAWKLVPTEDDSPDTMSAENASVTAGNCQLPEEFSQAIDRKRILTTVASPSTFLEEEFELYRRYQMHVHNDSESQCTRRSFRDFLVDTPLTLVLPREENGFPGFGSFHLQYCIDNRLVGLSIIDILPRCISSKYFIWNPDFAPLSLGKVSALMEIEWVQKLNRIQPSLEYYYMGFYIQSCHKMSYKGDYTPSELLCPQSYQWVQLTGDVRSCIEDSAYCVLSEIPGAQRAPSLLSSPPFTPIDINSLTIRVDQERMSFGEYVAKIKHLLGELFNTDRRKKHLELEITRVIRILTRRIGLWTAQTLSLAQSLVYECENVVG